MRSRIYRECGISIDVQPYCAGIKCTNGSHIRTWVFLPLAPWYCNKHEALLRMTYPSQQHHGIITEMYALHLFLVTFTKANNIFSRAKPFILYKQAILQYQNHLNVISKVFRWTLKIRNCTLIPCSPPNCLRQIHPRCRSCWGFSKESVTWSFWYSTLRSRWISNSHPPNPNSKAYSCFFKRV